MSNSTPATSPRAIINCRNCKRVTGIITLEGAAARDAYVLGGVHTRCPVCQWSVLADAVRGTYSATKKCGGACLHAKRGDCECQCGGENHGTGG
jgi:hypothetical protein